MYYTYFVTNKGLNVLYVGVTNDLVRRIYAHKNKVADGFTKKYNVDRLVYYEMYSDINLAIAREKQIKGWSRKKKDVLLRSKNPLLEELYDGLFCS
jgi:putative endonuclease